MECPDCKTSRRLGKGKCYNCLFRENADLKLERNRLRENIKFLLKLFLA